MRGLSSQLHKHDRINCNKCTLVALCNTFHGNKLARLDESREQLDAETMRHYKNQLYATHNNNTDDHSIQEHGTKSSKLGTVSVLH